MSKLTKTVVDKSEPRDRQYTVWCGELKGFGVFVLPSGTRTYFVDYRNANNVRRRMKLGRHGQITAEQARTRGHTYARIQARTRERAHARTACAHARPRARGCPPARSLALSR